MLCAETGDDVKNVEVNFGMLKTLIEARADLTQAVARTVPTLWFDLGGHRGIAGMYPSGVAWAGLQACT